jgi:hypothetical protein
VRRSLLVLAGYTALSFLYFGLPLLPHPGRYVLGTGADPDIFVWSFAWWPHAILDGQNPFVTHAVWAPDGINLAWVTSVPGLALPFAPLTLAFGPVVAYNVCSLLLPALAAWTGFLLCREATRSFWPAVVGGYLFGFSSYMLGQLLGHLHMSSVFLVPLAALYVLRFVRGELAPRGLAWRLGVLLAFQLLLSTEVALTLTLALVVSVLLAYAFLPGERLRLRALPPPVAGGYLLGALLASPLLWFALSDFEHDALTVPAFYSADVANLVVPTRLVGLRGGIDLAQHFPGNPAEQGAYLGLPVLLVLAWFAVRRRDRVARLLLALAGAAFLLMLGNALWIGGHRIVTLPWRWASELPLLNNVLPVRFALFLSLVAAVVVALWARDAPRRAALPLCALAVAFLVPAAWDVPWKLHPDRPAFFADRHLLEACLPEGENELVFPFGSREHSMLWQAESGFRFRIAGGYLRPDVPPTFDFQAIRDVVSGAADPSLDEILEVARAKGVARILSLERYQHPSWDELQPLAPVQLLGGVMVAPACGYPGIAESSRSSSS